MYISQDNKYEFKPIQCIYSSSIEIFPDLDILTYGIRNNNNLSKMQIMFENIIRPTEERVALKLKQELNKEFEETRQVKLNSY